MPFVQIPCIVALLCIFFTAIVFMVSYNTLFCERIQTMNIHTESQNSESWVDHIREISASKKSGQFLAADKTGSQVILEWHIFNLLSPECAQSMAGIWDIAAQAYVPVEMQFLRTHSEVVGTEPYFKPFEPLFIEGSESVDWKQAQEIMQSMLKNHFVYDLAQLPEAVKAKFAHDLCVFVTVTDVKAGQALGFMTFMISPNYAFGTVKVYTAGVMPKAHNRGLGKLLMSSIFRIIPAVTEIFLCTRVTNETALRAYRAWGFVHNNNSAADTTHGFNLNHWTFMNYHASQVDGLQKIAATMTAKNN